MAEPPSSPRHRAAGTPRRPRSCGSSVERSWRRQSRRSWRCAVRRTWHRAAPAAVDRSVNSGLRYDDDVMRSSGRRTNALTICRATTSRPTTSTSTACECTTSTRDHAAAGRSCAFTASRVGRTLYRKMIGPLGRCRQSRRRSATTRGSGARTSRPTGGWYTYDRHTELTSRVLAGLDLSDAIVVVQDWGGAIGLRWAGGERRSCRRACDLQHRIVHWTGLQGVPRLARLRREESGLRSAS